MAFYDITQEELTAVQEYLEGGENTDILFTDAPVRLLNLTDALRRRMLDDLRKARRENARLRKQLARLQKAADAQAEAGDFEQLDFDSVEVAAAIRDCLRIHDADADLPMVGYMLFDVYANWLHSHRQRLFAEHPVASPWGPVFWRVSKRLPGTAYVGAYARLAEKNDGVAALVHNVALKYCTWDTDLMRRRLTACGPYLDAHKDRNGGKWNKELSDSSIFRWERERYGS